MNTLLRETYGNSGAFHVAHQELGIISRVSWMSLLRLTAVAALALALCNAARAATAEITINVIEARGEGMEFILAHTKDQDASFRTGAVKKAGERTWHWDIGTPKSDVYFYWNHFQGVAEVSIRIDGTTLFSGRCRGNHTGNTRIADTCRKPKVYRQKGYPSIREPQDEPVSIVVLKPTSDA